MNPTLISVRHTHKIGFMEATCTECGRIFDLTDTDDSNEYHYGHDCEDN